MDVACDLGQAPGPKSVSVSLSHSRLTPVPGKSVCSFDSEQRGMIPTLSPLLGLP